MVALITAAAALIQRYLPQTAWLASSPAAILVAQTDLIFYLGLILFSVLGLAIYSRGRLWRVGLARPIGHAWWLMLPVAAVAAAVGGVVVPWKQIPDMLTGLKVLYAVVLIPLAGELLIRGLAHGILAARSRVQSCGSGWALSFSAVGTAFIYAGFLVLMMAESSLLPPPEQLAGFIRVLLAALAFGLAAGLAREKSQSLLPGILFQAAAVAVLVFVTGALF